MRTLHLINSMNPAFGGLAAHLRSLVPELSALGHPSEIASLDAPDAMFLPAIPARVHALGPVRPGFGYAPRLRPWLRETADRFDAVVVHGLWQYHGLATRLAFAPGGPPRQFIFPHGMLDPWFKRTYPLRHFRKWVYWWLAERRILRDAAAVLFTCEEERRLARQTFPGSSYRERVVAYGVAAPPDEPARQRAAFFALYPDLRDRPCWLFLGRIHPKKGVELLIDAYAALRAGDDTLPRLVIAGPCADAGYLGRLQARAAKACPPGAVHWPGMLAGDVKWGALRAAEAFVLPSHQENFGIAVVEALACGTPVLISDQVNIWREIIADAAGLVEPDTAAGTLRLLGRWRALEPEAGRHVRTAARRSFLKRYEIGAVARSLVAALQAPRDGQPLS
ncbi:glycosyl transferase family 1 [Opitutaceae bacterium TAV5]|nr:glycosyl transferase family 1 [Opitutaceae bacterium TAV5]